jgi:hypothetical protein
MVFGRRRPKPAETGGALRLLPYALLYGEQPLDQWPPTDPSSSEADAVADPEDLDADVVADPDDADPDVDTDADGPSSGLGEPWDSFVRAREHVERGELDNAMDIWEEIAQRDGIESRHTLQAWHFLRGVGAEPTPEAGSAVLAAAAEVAVGGGHDLLVAYEDGSVRYLNHSGAMTVVEQVDDPVLEQAVDAWLAMAYQLALVVDVWDQPELPPLARGNTRVMMLTPAGPRFGQTASCARTSAPARSSMPRPRSSWR